MFASRRMLFYYDILSRLLTYVSNVFNVCSVCTALARGQRWLPVSAAMFPIQLACGLRG